MKLAYGFLTLLAISNHICAQTQITPVIDAVEFKAIEGSQMIIRGSGFQSFSGEILSWDDFEKHPTGVNISDKRPLDGHVWSTIYAYEGKGIRVDESKKVSGKKSLLLDWGTDNNTIRAFGWAGKGPYDELYISYWRRMEGDFDFSKDNHKQFYLYGSFDGLPQLMPLIPGGTKMWGVYNNVGDGSVPYASRNNINRSGWTWENTANKFQRWEFFLKLNSPYTESNGVVKVWLDGEEGIANESYRATYVDGKFVDFRLGHMAQGFSSTAKAWFDDIYIATTQARVEICNSDVYEKCSIKHIQYVSPDSWKEREIVFELRGQELLKGHPVYIYVINSNGVPSRAFRIPAPKPPIT